MKKYTGFFLLFLWSLSVFAASINGEQSVFNEQDANQQFVSIQKKFVTHHDYATLSSYVAQLEDLQSNAKDCVSDADAHLKVIDQLLKSTQIDHVSQLQHADWQYLQDKQQEYAKQLSACRLFVYRSQETLVNYKDVLQKLSANQILKRSTPIWMLADSHWLQSFYQLDGEKIISISGILQLHWHHWALGGLLFCVVMLVAIGLRRYLNRLLSLSNDTNTPWCALLTVISGFVIPCAAFGIVSTLLNIVYQDSYPVPTIELISHALLVLTLLLALIRYVFYPSATAPGLFLFPTELGYLFYKRIFYLLLVFFIGYVVSMGVREQTLAQPAVDLIRTVFLTVVSIMAVRILLLWYRTSRATYFKQASIFFIITLFIFALLSLIIIEWVGYHQLAVFIARALSLTVIYTVVMVSIWHGVELIYQHTDNKEFFFARKVHQLFGMKLNKKMHELALIKYAVHFAVLCVYLVLIMQCWNVSAVLVDSIVDGLLNGFKFFGLTVIPLRIVFALLSFSIIFLVGRLIATSIAKKHRTKAEEDTQIAISTITVYVSFAVAFVFAMLVTGVDFTGLAIIAGALSVGVGLGLQNIVNNFVSGLILLIEKPIKPGDRIVIGKTEGFVRKIRIRSTQIATLSKEDVIVPNADLITQQVTNYMFRDRHSRISCELGVAYGSDVTLVKKLLLQAAAGHPDIVHDAPNDPLVLFSRFGENALIFNLLCVILDVNKKYQVTSDLNFAIEDLFRQHQISMAFPQRELHIKTPIRFESA